MVIVILVGMLFSQFANAQKPEHKIKRNKSKHHIAILSKSRHAIFSTRRERRCQNIRFFPRPSVQNISRWLKLINLCG